MHKVLNIIRDYNLILISINLVERFHIVSCIGLGAYAEYKCMKETDSTYGCLAIKPDNISYEEATVVAYGGWAKATKREAW